MTYGTTLLTQKVPAVSFPYSDIEKGSKHIPGTYVEPFGIDFRRQNLTYVDVRFWRLKSIPAHD